MRCDDWIGSSHQCFLDGFEGICGGFYAFFGQARISIIS